MPCCDTGADEAAREVEEYRFTLSVAVGVIRRTRSGDTLETAINSIEYAVFQAKTGRHGFICYCDEVMLAELERRNSVIQILKDELKNPPLKCIISRSIRQRMEPFIMRSP